MDPGRVHRWRQRAVAFVSSLWLTLAGECGNGSEPSIAGSNGEKPKTVLKAVRLRAPAGRNRRCGMVGIAVARAVPTAER